MSWGCADVLCVSVAPFAQAMNALKSATVLSSAPAAGEGAEGHAVLIGTEGVVWRRGGGTKTFRLSENTKQTKATEEKRREEKRGEKRKEEKRRERKRKQKRRKEETKQKAGQKGFQGVFIDNTHAPTGARTHAHTA